MRKIVLKDCAAPDCKGVAHTKGLCLKHYQAVKREEKKARSSLPRSEEPRP